MPASFFSSDSFRKLLIAKCSTHTDLLFLSFACSYETLHQKLLNLLPPPSFFNLQKNKHSSRLYLSSLISHRSILSNLLPPLSFFHLQKNKHSGLLYLILLHRVATCSRRIWALGLAYCVSILQLCSSPSMLR